MLSANRITRRMVAVAVFAAGWPALTCGAAEFVSTKPQERVDYWQQRQAEITARLKDTPSLAAVRLVFLGDSITDFWHLGDNPWFPGLKCGRAVWDESFGGRPAENLGLNLGISGDRLEHVLFRLLPQSAGGRGEFDAAGLHPEFIVLMVGINNTFAAENPMDESVFAGIRAVLTAVRERQPTAAVILQSLLPTSDETKNRDLVRPVNQRLIALAGSAPFAGSVHYLDLYSAFVDAAGKQLSQHFNDGLHPNESGYRVWRDQLVPFLSRVRAVSKSKPASS